MITVFPRHRQFYHVGLPLGHRSLLPAARELTQLGDQALVLTKWGLV